MFEAYHLPVASASDISDFNVFRVRNVDWRTPILSPAAVARIAHALRQRRAHALARRHVASIIQSIDVVARRFRDPADPVRREADALLPAVTGYAPGMAAHVLDRMARGWSGDVLERLVRAELGNADVLDRFVPDPVRGVNVFAAGPDVILHILSGNVPGVAVTSLVRALLVKSASLAKTAFDEPVLAVLFARALADVDHDLASCLAITYWPGGDIERERAAMEHVDAVLLYGGADAQRAVRDRLPPGVAYIEHGPRISFGIVAREALSNDDTARTLADSVARATATFDQQGCVSPHVVYVESGGHITPRLFASMVADALDETERALPSGSLSPEEAAAIHSIRAGVEFRAIAGEDVEVFAPANGFATVIFEADVTFTASPLNRVLQVKPVADVQEIPGLVARARSLLQTVAVAAPAVRIAGLAPRLVASGVTRITTFEAMPFPPPYWQQDGRGPLRELVRWAEQEG